MLVNALASHRRLRRNQEVPSATPSAGRHDRVEPDDPGLRLTLLDGLARLDRVDRAVLVLRYWEDLDVAATADLLRLSPANVRTRSLRALQRLRAVLGSDLLDLPAG
jgi:DNA-directed RNA polymerase specialized sigma24 family protein